MRKLKCGDARVKKYAEMARKCGFHSSTFLGWAQQVEFDVASDPGVLKAVYRNNEKSYEYTHFESLARRAVSYSLGGFMSIGASCATIMIMASVFPMSTLAMCYEYRLSDETRYAEKAHAISPFFWT
jgi:hypothetical protein